MDQTLSKYPKFSYNDAYNESLKSQKLVENQMHKTVKDAPRSINEAEYEAKTSTSYGTSAGSLNPPNLPLDAYKHNVGDLASSEKRITISNFLQNLNNSATLLGTDKVLRTIDNKNIVTNIGSDNTPQGNPQTQNIPQAPTPTPLTPQSPRERYELSQTPIKKTPSESSPGNTPIISLEDVLSAKSGLKPIEEKDDNGPIHVEDLPMIGLTDLEMNDILPPQLKKLFKNGVIPKNEVLRRLTGSINNVNRRLSMKQPGGEFKINPKEYIIKLIDEVNLLPDDSFIQYHPPSGDLYNKHSQSGGKVFIKNYVKHSRPAKREDIPLGNLLIDQHQLFNNVVSAKKKSNYKQPNNLPNKTVSPRLARMIYDISQGKMNSIPTSQLSYIEQDYLNRLLQTANLNKGRPFLEKRVLLAPTFGGLKKQLLESVGEALAGNNNPEILERIGDILTYLQNYYNFPSSTAQQILKSVGL